MSFRLDNTFFYAKKNDDNNYTLHAVAKHDFYAKDNWKAQNDNAYLLNVKALQEGKRKEIVEKRENNEFELIRKEYTAEELESIFGSNWQVKENTIEFEKGIDYNLVKLLNLKHINTEKEAQSLVDILNVRLKDKNTPDMAGGYKLEKFTHDNKGNKTTYQLAAGQTMYQVMQNSDGSTHIESKGDPMQFSKHLLETVDLLRANTKTSLKSKVMDEIKGIQDPNEKYQRAKQILGILTQPTQVTENGSLKSSSLNKLKTKDANDKKVEEAGISTPMITFTRLAPIYKKKDNNKDDEYLDYDKYKEIAEDAFKRGYLVNAKSMIEQKDEQGHFVFSEQARQKLTDIFDIHHKDNESKLKTFCDYYMGSKDQEVSVTTSIN
ncbi:hypothetical protein [Cysteiniphilum sp. QT6929]|uniref:hypothetical protein n=1 Tax=Cysteiniphilum sp. QT6929 TaxID=2975055 RepID=UPI0024B3BC15|nr:hypothetical protein [Cysteiniphilum sp. QT6929]WHN64853.1 hypothetical protein NYP54_07295 [Cysteiniphilum sp. QT6929]